MRELTGPGIPPVFAPKIHKGTIHPYNRHIRPEAVSRPDVIELANLLLFAPLDDDENQPAGDA